MKPSPWLPPNPVRPGADFGGRPRTRHGKVVRWALKLTDAQVLELTKRLCAVLARSHDVEPQALRLTIAGFCQEMPKC